MCGISGVYNFGQSQAVDEAVVHRMLGMIQHRGPDSNGLYLEDKVALGHTRLAIIDLSGGDQPMPSENNRYWMVYNGEVYNYIELREELQGLGYSFRTQSDTEVIVNSFDAWGDACFEKFNGQWALAIWDNHEQSLTLSRDQVGICPLYYSSSANNFYFSSEIKCLFAVDELPRKFSQQGLSQLATLWGPLAPRTAYENVFEVPAGHILKIKGDQQTVRPYWQLTFDGAWASQPKPFKQAIEEMEQQLGSATRLRFERADVPVGAYLSGGLDSSITSYLVKQFTDTAVDTYSLRFSDAEFDEGEYQQMVAADLGTNHHQVSVSNEDIVDNFREMLFHAERPVLRTAPVPMFLLSRLVRQNGRKVVVTGEGADEMLAGYDLFREAKVRRFIGRMPDSEKRKKLVEKLYPWMHRNPGQAPAFAKSFFTKAIDLDDPGLSHRPRWNTSGSLLQFICDPVAETESEVFEKLPQGWENWHPLELSQWMEITTLLPSYLISAQGDRMLMGNSVEGRFPFLDFELIKFSSQLNPLYKLWGLNEKYILKRTFGNKIPRRVIDRPKQPYRAPDAGAFFAGQLRDWVEDLVHGDGLDAVDGVVHSKKVKNLLKKGAKFGAKKMSNTDNMRIVAMLSTAVLHQQFIQGAAIKPRPIQLKVRVDRRSAVA